MPHASPGVANTAEMEEVQTMAPPPALSMPGRTARVIRNMDVTFFAKRASHSAKVRSRNGLTDSPPAWLKRQTHGPCAASAAATASDTYPRRTLA